MTEKFYAAVGKINVPFFAYGKRANSCVSLSLSFCTYMYMSADGARSKVISGKDGTRKIQMTPKKSTGKSPTKNEYECQSMKGGRQERAGRKADGNVKSFSFTECLSNYPYVLIKSS